MANRDHEDRDWDGWQRDRGGDDRQVRGGRGYGSQGYGREGGFDRPDHEAREEWGGSGGRFGGQRGGYVGQGFSRGGMSQSGGEHGRGEHGRGGGEQGSTGRGSMGGVNFRDEGHGSRQAQADMGYDNFGGGAFRAGTDFAEAQGGGQGGGQGFGQSYRGASHGYDRGDDERFGRARGATGGAFGSGERDYGDHRTDRDRSLLGELASMLGFGGARGDQGGQGYGQVGGQGGNQGQAGQGYGQGQGMGQPGLRRGMGPRNYVRSDARIEEDVNERLSHGHLDATDVEVTVKEGEVTLSGTVRSRGDKRLAEDIAHDVSGVRHVQNNLRVQDNWTGGGMVPGMSSGSSSGASSGSGQGASMGSVVGASGSATNVTVGQDPRQMAGQSSGQASAESGSQGTSQAGSQSAKPEPNRF